MSHKMHKDLRHILHPYMFVLREGREFHENLLDYSLMMLHVNCLEVMESPRVVASAPAHATVSANLPSAETSDAPAAIPGAALPSNQ